MLRLLEPFFNFRLGRFATKHCKCVANALPDHELKSSLIAVTDDKLNWHHDTQNNNKNATLSTGFVMLSVALFYAECR
jgi:hypothetical protein